MALPHVPVMLLLALLVLGVARSAGAGAGAGELEGWRHPMGVAQGTGGRAHGVPVPVPGDALGMPTHDIAQRQVQVPGEGQGQGWRRGRSLAAAGWRFLGVGFKYARGPTVGGLNVSFFRYESVVPDARGKDWRTSPALTPVQVQWDCSSCWAMAAVDSVAVLSALSTGSAPRAASTQEVCECGGGGCCAGGWPEDALAYVLRQGSISSAAAYPYLADDSNVCARNASYPIAGSITGWERVPSYSQDALLKAVTMQPVLVYISASSDDFKSYSSGPPSDPSSFRVYDGSCSNEVNHAMLAVGYNLSYPGGYWVLKNTWPAWGWGHNGYMYLAMRDGAGTCGMQIVNPVFPVSFPGAPNQVTVAPGANSPVPVYSGGLWWDEWKSTPGADPCPSAPGRGINPCGSGDCWAQGGIARCNCTWPYVDLKGAPTSKCVHSSPCTSALVNPCVYGLCTDVGDGSYLCTCQEGYETGYQVEGSLTCIPMNVSRGRTYKAGYGDTCTKLQGAYKVDSTTFLSLNPFLPCNSSAAALVPGVVAALPLSSTIPCRQTYAIRSGDTCQLLSLALAPVNLLFGIVTNATSLLSAKPLGSLPLLASLSTLLLASRLLQALNPALDCSHLYPSQQVCVLAANASAQGASTRCSALYETTAGDNCTSAARINGISLDQLLRWNPGLNCNWRGGAFTRGIQLCVAQAAQPRGNCSQLYTVQQGDTCAQIWNAANLSQFQFMAINQGLRCQKPYLFVGQQVCVNSPLLANFSDPDYLVYTVGANDTWANVQYPFTRKCQPWSITVPRIAEQNSITNWTSYELKPDTTLVIPCVPRIGASCGCAPSLPVCGADNINYQSYCDAQCNFALPVSNSACSNCQQACAGRPGRPPSPDTACPSGTICPWPTWSPPKDGASQYYTDSPLCNYRTQTCKRVCAMYSANYGSATNSTCYNSCYACNRIPCSGPSEVVSPGSQFCRTCTSAGCKPYGRTACITDCTYWNSMWSPLNP